MSYQLGYTAGLVGYMLLVWFITRALNLSYTWLYMVQLILGSMGFGVFGWALWWRQRRERRAQAGQGAAMDGTVELEAIVRDAEARLMQSRLGKEGRIGMLPAIIVLGERASAKTSTILASSAEPELLSGQIYQDGLVAPTRMANLWFARDTVVAEAGSPLLNDPGRWLRLVDRLRPKRLRTLFSKASQAPRAAVVCVNVETFLQPGAQEILTQLARKLHTRLLEIAERLGIHLPVYVIFTRCDRLPFFQDYLANFTDGETRQALGATVPMALGYQRSGVYAEEETKRLTAAFHDIFLGLAEFRLLYLGRETSQQRVGGIYEFPREFRKLRSMAVQFLVDLCRPSQLQAGPFLRGFYFSGVRPVETRELVQAPQSLDAYGRKRKGATGIFSMEEGRESTIGAFSQHGPVRRVPQWVFLAHLFNDVILRDTAASATSASSAGRSATRRYLLMAGAALAFFLSIAWTISFLNNRRLEREVSDAVATIGNWTPSAAELASMDSLRRLDTLRVSLGKLIDYRENGAPWSHRWGLYCGNDLLPTVRRLYFSRFHQLIFGQTQAGLLEWLRALPAAPGPEDEYQPTYDTLKAYLITTSHPDKSTKLFLGPLLTARWAGKNTVEPDRRRLAQTQFEFYAEELKRGNPFTSENDSQAIEHARDYLNQFSAIERIYAFLLAEANAKNKGLNFNRDYPGSAAYIQNDKEVPGAFTRSGYGFMMEAIRNYDRYFGGEEWVLGPKTKQSLDRATIEPALLSRYTRDYLGKWRDYLKLSRVLPYANVRDAATKLQQLSGPTSYLLALFCEASVGTAGAREEAKAPFQSVQYVTPPTCKQGATVKYVDAPNEMYMQSLGALQVSLGNIAGMTTPQPGDPAVSSTLNQTTNAKTQVQQMSLKFQPDAEGKIEQTVRALLEAPITYAERLLAGLGPQQLNGAGQNFCREYNTLANKYPFNTASTIDASLGEFSAVFRPGTGALWVFYENNLRNYLRQEGDQYIPSPGSPVKLTPQFVQFFNRAAQVSQAFYRTGSEPSITYKMTAMPVEGAQGMTLRLEGDELKTPKAGGGPKQFRWTGGQEAHMLPNFGGQEFEALGFRGTWATFRFFGDADVFERSGDIWRLTWRPRSGQSGQALKIDFKYTLDLMGAPPIFQKNFLGLIRCIPQVAVP